MPRDSQTPNDQSWLSREDLQDLAKIGGDLLKRTVTSSLDVLKDVTDSLPKDAQNIISKSREEMLKGISREFAKNFVSLAVEKVFSAVREHRLEISIRVRKEDEKKESSPETKVTTPTTGPGHENRREQHRHGFKKSHQSRHHSSQAK